MESREKGYTLVELIVVMAIFVVVIMITGNVFNTIQKSSVKTSKSVETEITDIIGLEVMRVDIKHAGYGLPYFFPTPVQYDEASNVVNTPVDGVNRKDYNDGLGTGVNGNPPRPFVIGDNAGVNGSDYLVVKSTLLGSGLTATKWNYLSSTGGLRNWDDAAQNLATNGENVIVVDPAYNSPVNEQRQLIINDSTHFIAKYKSSDELLYIDPSITEVKPSDSTDTYLVYGIADAGVTPRMPFNRADYYIRRPADISERCAPGTGILYKAVLDQATGGYSEVPLMDCVGDVQVVFGFASNAPTDMSVNLHDDNLSSMTTLYDLTNQLKEVRLYILTHEGRRSSGYSYPSNTINVGEDFGAGVLGSVWTHDGALAGSKNLSTTFTNWQNYYWKVLKVVVIPSNL